MLVDYPVAWDADMPQRMQQIFLAISALLLASVAIKAIRVGVRYRTPLPIFYLIGGACAVIVEAIVGNVGQSFHPPVGQISAFTTMDRSIPWHVVLTYSAYFGGLPVLLFERMVNRSITGALLMRIYCITVVVDYVAEIVPVSYGLWTYYGNQALWIWKGTVPLSWVFNYGAWLLAAFVCQYLALPYLRGWRQIFAVPLNIFGFGAAFMGLSAIMVVAQNSTWGRAALEAAGVISVLMSFMIVWLMARLVDSDTAPKHTHVPAFGG